MVYDQLDMTKNWPAKMLWKAEQTHDQEQDKQEVLVLSKMEKQNKLHGNESSSVVSVFLKPPSSGIKIKLAKQTTSAQTPGTRKDIKFIQLVKTHALNKKLKRLQN